MRAAIDLRPDWAKAHFLLGTALALTGERTAARTELARALELDASILEARRLLVDVHAALGEHEYAVEEGRRYPHAEAGRRQDADPCGPEPGDPRDGSKKRCARSRAIPEENRDVEVNYAIGRIHLGRGEKEEARQYLSAALDQRPGHADILRSLLDLDRREGRLDESVGRIETALAAEPESATLQQLKGTLSLMQGKGADAEAAFKRSIELDPNLVSSYRQLANFYAATGPHRRDDPDLREVARGAAQPAADPPLPGRALRVRRPGVEGDRALRDRDQVRAQPRRGQEQPGLHVRREGREPRPGPRPRAGSQGADCRTTRTRRTLLAGCSSAAGCLPLPSDT